MSAMDSNGILNSDKFLRDFLRMYLDKESGLQQTLILCLMRAFISKANGHKNPNYGPTVNPFLRTGTKKIPSDTPQNGTCRFADLANNVIADIFGHRHFARHARKTEPTPFPIEFRRAGFRA